MAWALECCFTKKWGSQGRCLLNTDQNKDGERGSHLEEAEGTASGDLEAGSGV